MSLISYGSKGRVGIGVPQANPTVEPEIGALLPDGVTMHVTRLTSATAAPRDRLIQYFVELDDTLKDYDTMRLDAYGFACTASSYLVGAAAEEARIAAIEAARGYRVITGARAIVAALKHLGVERIALGSPYPDWLSELSENYWRAAGFTIVATAGVDLASTDLRAIYDVGADAALEKVRTLTSSRCDCILMTGTGLPSLPVIAALQPELDVPIVSTNLCLAWALARALDIDVGPRASRFALLDGWQDRLKRL